jgi:hypothetical protein
MCRECEGAGCVGCAVCGGHLDGDVAVIFQVGADELTLRRREEVGKAKQIRDQEKKDVCPTSQGSKH